MLSERHSPEVIVCAAFVLVCVVALGLLLGARNVSAQQLPVRTYTTANGLPRDLVLRIVRDSHGFLWFCTADGLSRFNGYEFTTYGVEHGLPHPVINHLLETRRGVYWIATNGGGVARFNPSPLPNQQPQPRNLFTAYPVGDEPATNRVNILYEDHAGQVWAGTDGGLFRLDQSGGQEIFRRVELNLPQPDRPVRAFVEDSEGSLWVSTQGMGLIRRLPDGRTVRYAIQPSPLGDLVESLIELERVRTRIAADLHDDIGSGLSRIAILSEVARHQANPDSSVREPLATIAGASRDLVDSMSDIVWAINPNRDHLRDLIQRMRRFASDLFTALQIEFSFNAPGEEQALRIGADLRRQVFLIFKEAVNNIARHSTCTEAQIEMRIENRWLTIRVVDNGPGFDLAQTTDGQGLAGMRARAESLGGELQINSNDGSGTTVLLRVPLSARAGSRDGRVR